MADPLTIAAIGSALASLGLTAFGPKGKHRQTGGPSDEDISREQAALRANRRAAAMEGGRAAMQSAGGVLARTGGARGGAVGTVAGNIGASLGQQLGLVEDDVSALGARLHGLQQYEYEPSWSEQLAGLTGKVGTILGSAAALRGAFAPAEKATGPLDLSDQMARQRAGLAPSPGRPPLSQLPAGGAAPTSLTQGLGVEPGQAVEPGLSSEQDPLAGAPRLLAPSASLGRRRRRELADLLDVPVPGEEYEERLFKRGF